MNKYYQTGGEETSVNFDDLEKIILEEKANNNEVMLLMDANEDASEKKELQQKNL